MKDLIVNVIKSLEGLSGKCEFKVEGGILSVKNVEYNIPLNAIANAVGDVAEEEEVKRQARQRARKEKADQLRREADSLDY